MSRPLASLLDEFAAERARASAARTPDLGPEVRAVRAAARRRRALRGSAIGVGAAAAVVAGAFAVQALTQPAPTPPPATEPVVTPVPSPSPGPTRPPSPTSAQPETEAPDAEPTTPDTPAPLWPLAWDRCGDPSVLDVVDGQAPAYVDAGGATVAAVGEPAQVELGLATLGDATALSATVGEAWVVRFDAAADSAFPGEVVGVARGVEAPTARGVVTPDGGVAVTTTVELLGCAGAPEAPTPLPAGEYQLLLRLDLVTDDGATHRQWGWELLTITG